MSTLQQMSMPTIHILKNKQMIKCRAITGADASARHELFFALSEAGIGMVNEHEEISLHCHESEDKIDDFLRNRRGLWIIAETNQQIVAEIDIIIPKAKKLCHAGRLSIGVHPSVQGLGIGSILMEKALEWAFTQKLSRIFLDVFKSNTPAQKLYEKFGFVVEGIRKNHLRHRDGRFEDDILMAKIFLENTKE